MVKNKILKFSEALFTIWTILFGFAGILAVGSGDGTNIPLVAYYLVIVMAICAYGAYVLRKARQKRDHEEFLIRHHELRRSYP